MWAPGRASACVYVSCVPRGRRGVAVRSADCRLRHWARRRGWAWAVRARGRGACGAVTPRSLFGACLVAFRESSVYTPRHVKQYRAQEGAYVDYHNCPTHSTTHIERTPQKSSFW